MEFNPGSPPERICLLRLSALGDITHVLPTLRTLQAHWPETEITWVVGKTEYTLVKNIADVHFIVFDKSQGFAAYRKLYRDLRKHLQGKRFDILFHMQMAIRASVASLMIPARIRLGFDRVRARDMQTLFCNRYIQPASIRQHVLDSFLEFPASFGLSPVYEWQLPVTDDAMQSVKQKLVTDKPLLVINPCAVAKSKNWRNWTDTGYAAIADYAIENLGMQVALSGGNSELEKTTADNIISQSKNSNIINLVGKTSIEQLVAVLKLARVVIAPDTGPVHIASALRTSTIGLYATTNPDRAGPYNYREYVVNKYPQALLKYNQSKLEDAPWGERVKTADAMQLISTDDVIDKLNTLLKNNDR